MAPYAIFISYAHADERFKNQLVQQLQGLQRQGLIKVWHDRCIDGGSEWRRAIARAQEGCDLAVLLLSPAFIASDFIQREEWPQLQARRAAGTARVLPILVLPCAWKLERPLEALQLRPIDGHAIAGFNEDSGARAQAWLDIVEEIAGWAAAHQGVAVGAPEAPVAPPGVSMQLSVLPPPALGWHDVEPRQLAYSARPTEAGLEIEATLPYWSAIKAGALLEPLESSGLDDFQWEHPALDIRLLNNGARTLFVNELLVRVTNSRIDPEPLLLLRSAVGLRFRIDNVGWGEVHDLALQFALSPLLGFGQQPPDDAPLTAAALPHSVAVGDFAGRAEVDLAPALAAEGVDLAALARVDWADWRAAQARVAEILGRFSASGPIDRMRSAAGGVTVSGLMQYTADTLDQGAQPMQLQFRTRVALGSIQQMQQQQAAPPPSHEYGTRLDVSDQAYERRVPAAQVLRAGEADRFLLRLGMAQSARFELRLTLLCNEGVVVESPPLRLSAWVPRRLRPGP